MNHVSIGLVRLLSIALFLRIRDFFILIPYYDYMIMKNYFAEISDVNLARDAANVSRSTDKLK